MSRSRESEIFAHHGYGNQDAPGLKPVVLAISFLPRTIRSAVNLKRVYIQKRSMTTMSLRALIHPYCFVLVGSSETRIEMRTAPASAPTTIDAASSDHPQQHPWPYTR